MDELKVINGSLRNCIVTLRTENFSNYDTLIKGVIDSLKRLGGKGDVISYEDNRIDSLIISGPLTKIQTKINYPTGGYSLTDLIQDSKDGCFLHLQLIFKEIIQIIQRHELKTDFEKLLNWHTKSELTGNTSRKLLFNNGEFINLTILTSFYICAHFNCADLPMLSDFDEFKDKISLLKKSFVTLGKPLKFGGVSIYFRDTQLLAPTGKGSLEQIGELYQTEGDFKKRVIDQTDKDKISLLLARDRQLFEDYAIQDVIIILKHSTEMERFNMSIKQLGVPLTLSSKGRNYVFDSWRTNFKQFFPYQISGKCLTGNVDEVQTPKGLFETREVGLHMSYFIGNYKGGRNESFMYGCDDDTDWFDYDLSSAYTTAMTHLPLPDYQQAKLIPYDEVKTWDNEKLMAGFVILHGDFKFPKKVKYPSIPCYIDEKATVYPLEGSCLITGPEFILAKNQGCEFEIKSIFFFFYTPPAFVDENKDKDKETKSNTKPKSNTKTKTKAKTKEQSNRLIIRPFHQILKEIQGQRKKHPKNSFRNLLYKDVGNSIYGNVVRGLSNKKAFDSLSGKMTRVRGTELSNPILASWTTAFIRSVIGECIHNISLLPGKVVSVTTDGFITDIEHLEEKLLTLPEKDRPLLTKYRELRIELGGKGENALELKKSGKGIISWTTRGPLGIGSTIKATTGFQAKEYAQEELVKLFKDVLKGSEKFFEFTHKSLRGAKDIFCKGGHVTAIFKDQKFRMYYDNRRQIVEPEGFKGKDLSSILLDSKPLDNIYLAKKRRFQSKFPFTFSYNKNSSGRVGSKYKSYLEISVRNFIKGFTAKESYFGLRGDEFKSYRELMSFIYDFESAKGIKLSNIKISEQSISNLKHRRLIWRPVPRNEENIKFAEYLKERLPHFRVDEFLMRGVV